MHWALWVGALSVSEGQYQIARVCCYVVTSILPGRTHSREGLRHSKDTLAVEQIYYQRGIIPLPINCTSTATKQFNWGVGFTPNEYTVNMAACLHAENNREQDTITPWNKCKASCTSSFSLIYHKIKANIIIILITKVWDKGVGHMPQGVCEQLRITQ